MPSPAALMAKDLDQAVACARAVLPLADDITSAKSKLDALQGELTRTEAEVHRLRRPTQHRSTLVAPAGERRCQSRPPAARLHKHTLTLLHTVSNHMAFPIQNGKGRSDVCRAVAERTSRC
jgi:hypothetical protein